MCCVPGFEFFCLLSNSLASVNQLKFLSHNQGKKFLFCFDRLENSERNEFKKCIVKERIQDILTLSSSHCSLKSFAKIFVFAFSVSEIEQFRLEFSLSHLEIHQ